MPESPSDEFIQQAMIEAIAEWATMITRAVGGRIEEHDGVYLCDFESTHPYRNATIVTRPLTDDDVDRLIPRLFDFYRRDHGWVVITAHPLPADDPLLHYGESEPIMVLDDPSSFDARPVPGLSIVDVTTAADVVQFERLRAALYPVDHLHRADERELWNGDVLVDGNHLFIGYVDGEPVATGGSWSTSKINELTSFATRPSHRGKGIARAMMRYGLEQSDRLPVLFAHVDAESAYVRMGFRTIGEVAYWVPPCFEAKYPGGWAD